MELKQLLKLIAGLLVILSINVACEEENGDSGSDLHYVGVWVTYYTDTINDVPVDMKQELDIKESSFTSTEYAQYGGLWVPVIGQKGDILVDGMLMTVTFTHYGVYDLTTGNVNYYEPESDEFIAFFEENFGGDCNCITKWMEQDNVLTIIWDTDNDGVYSDEKGVDYVKK